MKKVAGIVLGFIAAIIVAAISIYYIRDYQAKRQLVHKHGTSFLILSIDELLIDNIVSAVRATSKDTLGMDSAKTQFLKDLAHAGLPIPAHLLLFSLPENSSILYSVHTMKDPEAWNRFIAKYSEANELEENVKTNRLHRLHQYIQVATKGDRVVFRFGTPVAQWTVEESALLEPSEDLIPLSELESYRKLANKGHMNYWQSDGRFALTGEIATNKISIGGHWLSGGTMQVGPYSMRKMRGEDAALMLWSRLPLQAIPAIHTTLTRFAGVDASILRQNPPSYLDLLVSKQLVSQQDSIITYEYDEDFNPIETKTVQTVNAPLIESLWKGDPDLDKRLPDKLFYKLYRYSDLNAVMLTTQKSAPYPIHYEESPYIFMLRLNMVNWPAGWLTGALHRLQQAGVTATLSAKPKGDDAVTVSGEIVSDDSFLSLF